LRALRCYFPLGRSLVGHAGGRGRRYIRAASASPFTTTFMPSDPPLGRRGNHSMLMIKWPYVATQPLAYLDPASSKVKKGDPSGSIGVSRPADGSRIRRFRTPSVLRSGARRTAAAGGGALKTMRAGACSTPPTLRGGPEERTGVRVGALLRRRERAGRLPPRDWWPAVGEPPL